MDATPTYRVKDWARHFENAESRRCKHMLWIAVPTKMTGRGFRRVAASEANTRILGAWLLMLQLAAGGNPRGTLAANDGPYTAEDMALLTGFPSADFRAAIEVLTRQDVGWLEVAPGDARVTPGCCPGNARATLHDITGHDMTLQDITLQDSLKNYISLADDLPGGSVARAGEDVQKCVLSENPGDAATLPCPNPPERGSGEAGAQEAAAQPEDPAEKIKTKAEGCPAREIALAWNEAVAATSIPQVRDLTPARRTTLRGMWAWLDGDRAERLSACRAIFGRVAASAFCRGETGGTWIASFDWAIAPSNRVKILEGRYDDRPITSKRR